MLFAPPDARQTPINQYKKGEKAFMTTRDWVVTPDRPDVRGMLEDAGYTPLLARVLAARGVQTPAQAQDFLSPEEKGLSEPALLLDMDQAVTRIRQALLHKERMAVFGDYDVDGITSACLFTDFLTQAGGNVTPYIPDRMEEGYGLNADAVRELAAAGVTLIITVDCGITAVEETALAISLGVDVVITDHHTCKETLPRTFAVVDPHRPDCPTPFKDLAGVGVALKVAMAVAGPEWAGAVFQRYCDLAAIGTVADVMPIQGENRTIVRCGLQAIRQSPRLGLSLLLQEAGLGGKPLTSVSIGYTLAPRINAAGRMGRASLAVELLLAQDEAKGRELAKTLCELNHHRQTIEGDIFQTCVDRLAHKPQPDLIFLSDENWHQGVVGIVASRLAQRYAASAFMVCLNAGVGKGSCRSWGGINLFALLERCSDLLEGFGGHALAAGFTVREENLPALQRRLHQELPQVMDQTQFTPHLTLDGTVRPDELSVENIVSLDALEPCGNGNPRPTLLLSGATVQNTVPVGRGRHLKLRLEVCGTVLDAIWFSVGDEAGEIARGSRVDVAFCPQINEFRGIPSVQLQIIALRPALTRAQSEQAIFDKFRQGMSLTADEALALLPKREDFVRVWHYLKGRSVISPVIEDTPVHIARGAARINGQREALSNTMVCLAVLQERGLISLRDRPDRLSITLNQVEGKVDLESSLILRRLRSFAG